MADVTQAQVFTVRVLKFSHVADFSILELPAKVQPNLTHVLNVPFSKLGFL